MNCERLLAHHYQRKSIPEKQKQKQQQKTKNEKTKKKKREKVENQKHPRTSFTFLHKQMCYKWSKTGTYLFSLFSVSCEFK